ncbi:ATP-dependent DNA ligase [Paenibacillus endoradicis]|uniref:ATP-dependent DNA ligase n=1 Tax=Paenibacillus endoradicis TaxID=2972487 RepID=UPI0021595968|nr:DNA ligase [Paenibacillus endoradicis]MCR8656910.1 DNA ligase [Paenibacillus endoradicis]
MMDLPKVPMAPVNSSEIPIGSEWRYQIKWDGVRTLVRLDGLGGVEIFSKRVEPRNDTFPEIVELLKPLRIGACVLDGEIAYFDGNRPNFQRVRLGVQKQKYDESLIFVAFDMLYDNGEDIRGLPFIERFERLQKHFPNPQPRLLVSDLFEDGEALWDWLKEREWEGLISKHIDSPYVEGKGHKHWYKKRKETRLTVDVVGVKLKSGQASSLVLRYKDRYIGHVSGLDNRSKQLIMQFAQEHVGSCPFKELTPGMKKSDVMWLSIPFACKVTALEFTDSGLLRQPKLLGFGV